MKKSGSTEGQLASELIDKRIAELGDWRGETLSRVRKLIKEADPDVVRSGSGWALPYGRTTGSSGGELKKRKFMHASCRETAQKVDISSSAIDE